MWFSGASNPEGLETQTRHAPPRAEGTRNSQAATFICRSLAAFLPAILAVARRRASATVESPVSAGSLAGSTEK